MGTQGGHNYNGQIEPRISVVIFIYIIIPPLYLPLEGGDGIDVLVTHLLMFLYHFPLKGGTQGGNPLQLMKDPISKILRLLQPQN